MKLILHLRNFFNIEIMVFFDVNLQEKLSQ